MIKYGLCLVCTVSLLLSVVVTSSAGISATVTVTPSSYQGACPVGVTVKGQITTTQAGLVSYEYVLSSGVKMPGTINFDNAGTQEVSAGFVAGSSSLPQYPASGWAAINIINTPGGMSNKAAWNFTCKYPDLTVTDITWTPYKTNMNAPLPLGNILFKYKNQGTGDSGPYELSLKCEGVPGTGPFGQTPICPVGTFPKTWPFSSSLSPGESNETGIISISGGNMPPKWGGGKYRITAEAKITGSAEETDKTNNVKVLEINVAWKPLTDISFMTLEGTYYKGECSSSKNVKILNGKISGNGYGVIKYQWVIDGATDGTVQELTYWVDDMLKEVGVITIALQDRTGWGRIKIVSPVQKESNTSTFSIACSNPNYDMSLIGKLNLTFGKWKNLGKLSPAPQACQGCAATFNQIGGIDQKSMILVKEGELLTQKLSGRPSQPERDSATKRLNEINNQLDANMTQRNGLVAQYNKQAADFNIQPRKSAPLKR